MIKTILTILPFCFIIFLLLALLYFIFFPNSVPLGLRIDYSKLLVHGIDLIIVANLILGIIMYRMNKYRMVLFITISVITYLLVGPTYNIVSPW